MRPHAAGKNLVRAGDEKGDGTQIGEWVICFHIVKIVDDEMMVPGTQGFPPS